MTQFTTLDLSVINHVAHLQLCRPAKLNSMTTDFWREFPLVIAELAELHDLRVLVISAQGPHFCAGMDLDVFQNPNNFPSGQHAGRANHGMRRFVKQLQQVFTDLEALRVPVISAVQGGCIGGALDMIAATDMRYCTADAFFTIKEVQLGITADLGSLQRLPSILPQGIVRELAFTGRNFSAQEALQFGLVNRVYPDHAALIEGVMKMAKEMASLSPLAMTGTKEMLNYSRDHSVADSLEYMATWQAGMLSLDETMNIMQSQMKKVQPEFAALHDQTPLFLKTK